MLRLKTGHAEERIWKTQFGFRSNFGTNDALFMVRRLIDKAVASKNENLIILALDWAKAFDSIAPEALCLALRRFGIGTAMASLIADIYTDRIFKVQWDGQMSNFHPQKFGISQGCPLSPFLFSILMTVLMHDCRAKMGGIPMELEELLYADDTLLIGREPAELQRYMDCIATEACRYGF